MQVHASSIVTLLCLSSTSIVKSVHHRFLPAPRLVVGCGAQVVCETPSVEAFSLQWRLQERLRSPPKPGSLR